MNIEKEFEEIKNEEKKEMEKKFEEISSEKLNDGTLVEMIYDQKIAKTSFAICKNDQIEIKNRIESNNQYFKPHSANKDLLKNRVVLFPSRPVQYESQEKLIRDIQCFIHKYLSVSNFFEKIASYYILFSWIYDDFNELPYLRGLGDYGTGKSRLLQVVGSICYTPIFASGATTVSPIFRILNDFKGTLILDEADFKLSDTTAEIVKILNSGFMKNMPVLRSEGNNKKSFDVKAYNVFGPKVIATRNLYKDSALESRMITEDMNLTSLGKGVPYNIPDSFWEEALTLRNKLLVFRFKNKGKIVLNPELGDRSIEPRLNQIAIPLMSTINNPKMILEIKQQFKEYNERIKTDRTLDYNYQILDAICELIDRGFTTPTIKQVTETFNKGLEVYDGAISSKKMGFLIRKTLNMRTERTRDGFIISENNREKIEILRKKYDIKNVNK